MSMRKPDEGSWAAVAATVVVMAIVLAPLCLAVRFNNPAWLWAWVPIGLALLLGLA